uniref:Galectin n=1 Tax=Romanomermis culicivorax TaxID=13658 RepID=A0A915L8A4_ROMCU
MTHPFYLRLPYVAKLDNQIEPGQSLIVRGQSTNDTFVINLATSSSIEDCKDLVLHVSIRVKKGTIVFNSLSNGQWGKEEVHKCPLEKGQDFSVRIRSHPDKFEVFLKGKSLGSFDYRQPISTISHVQILGDLVLNAVGWEGNYYVKKFFSRNLNF